MSDLLERLDAAYKSDLSSGDLWNLCEESAERIRELEALVRKAYDEGFSDGYASMRALKAGEAGWSTEESWQASETREYLEGKA